MQGRGAQPDSETMKNYTAPAPAPNETENH